MGGFDQVTGVIKGTYTATSISGTLLTMLRLTATILHTILQVRTSSFPQLAPSKNQGELLETISFEGISESSRDSSSETSKKHSSSV